jgi:hypothetical protein
LGSDTAMPVVRQTIKWALSSAASSATGHQSLIDNRLKGAASWMGLRTIYAATADTHNRTGLAT